MGVRDSLATDEQRRAALLALDPESTSVLPAYLSFLGDPSWRVRKAAVMLLDRLLGVDGLAGALVAGLGEQSNAGLRNACSEALLRLGGRAVEPLASALSSADSDHRKFIVEVLGTLGTDAARDVLLDLLDDEDENVRAAVVESLGRIGGRAVIERLSQRLGSCQGDMLQTAYLLGALVSAKARLTLERLASYEAQSTFAREVYALLGLSQDPRAVPVLVAGLSNSSAGNRAAAIRALEVLARNLDASQREQAARQLRDDKAALEVLDRVIQDENENEDVARGATLLLGLLRDPRRAPQILRACACRPFVQVGVEAVTALGAMAVEPLLDAVERVDVESRVLYLEVLESIGNAAVAEALVPMLGTFDTRSAEAAVRVLGALGGASSVQALLHLARSAEPALWRPIALALARLGVRHGDSVAKAVRATLEDAGRLPVLLLALGELEQGRDIAVLDAASHDQSAEVRLASIEAAHRFAERFPEETLILALADEHPGVRAAAARALAAHRSPRAIVALLAGSRDSEPWVAAEALQALGSARDPEVDRTLLAAASSTSSVVAIAALRSLFHGTPPGIEGAIHAGLRHADPEVAREALVLSTRLDVAAATDVLVACLQHRFWGIRLVAAQLLASRRLPVDVATLQRYVAEEDEPLVREALERLLDAQGDFA